MLPPAPHSTLFPYTTLFRSRRRDVARNLPKTRVAARVLHVEGRRGARVDAGRRDERDPTVVKGHPRGGPGEDGGPDRRQAPARVQRRPPRCSRVPGGEELVPGAPQARHVVVAFPPAPTSH